VFELMIYEAPNWQDQIRFDQQTAEAQDYQAQTQQHQVSLQQATQQLGEMQNHVLTVQMSPPEAEAHQGMMMQTLQQKAQLEAQAPQPPKWMRGGKAQPDPVRMEPIHTFAHGVCIEPLKGNLGFGFGRIEADINRAANIGLAQWTDACSLSNCSGWIMSDLVRWKDGGGLQIKPGHINYVTGMSVAQLKEHMIELKPGAPADGLLKLVEMMREFGQEAAQAPEALSGAPGKSGETFRGLATRIDQAVKQLSIPTSECARFLTQIGRNNMRLNSMFMKDEELFPFIDPTTGLGTQRAVSRKLYEQSFAVQIRADMQFSSKQQRIEEANELMGIVANWAPVQGNLSFAYQALVLWLKAKGEEKLVPFLGPAPAVPQQFGPPPMPMPGGPPGTPGATPMPQAAPTGKPAMAGPKPPAAMAKPTFGHTGIPEPQGGT
jgi:hypothetical protein